VRFNRWVRIEFGLMLLYGMKHGKKPARNIGKVYLEMKVNKSLIMADVTTHQAIVHFIASHIREASDAQRVANEIEQIAYSYDINLLVINFVRLQQMTSSFIGKLIVLQKSLKQAGIELRLCCMAREVEKAYKICKLDKLIPLYRTEEKALAG